MENEAVIHRPEEPHRRREDWAEAEWFQVWLRLARRDYQRHPQQEEELKRAA